MNRLKILLSFFLSLFFFSFALPPDMSQSEPYEVARLRMVKNDLEARDITDPLVLKAMGKVERHLFVEEGLRSRAYADYPLPLGEGQTISQPYIVALMTQLISPKPGEKVLEIGTGSGYQAAILAEIGMKVFTIEIRPSLAAKASDLLKRLGYSQVSVKAGDGYFGWRENAPFDAIIITCAANHIPPLLIEQLKEGGKLVIPLGETTFFQTLTVVIKVKGNLKVREITSVRFVPMTGEAEKR
jgi:protein-L-isoaspartate(D-aspartate) O-methyltransferase